MNTGCKALDQDLYMIEVDSSHAPIKSVIIPAIDEQPEPTAREPDWSNEQRYMHGCELSDDVNCHSVH